jgi:hypothetical protein
MQDYFTSMADAAGKWANHAQCIAEKLQQGSYTSADAASDLGQCVSLAIESASSYVAMVSQCMGAYAPQASSTQSSATFIAPTPGTAPLALTISASLTEPLTGDAIADAAVSFDPPVLAVGSTDFQLVVQTAGLTGGAYAGTVTTVPTPGSPDAAQDIAVWILIP